MHTDEPTLREHLGKAEHHVAEAEQRVADQRELVLELVGSGRLDLAKTARDGLEEMKELLAKHIAHRDRLVGELAKAIGTD